MPALAIVRDDRYLEHDPGAGHPESPDRLRVIHALIESEFGDLPLIPPRLATTDELALVHDPDYIRLVAGTEGRPHSRLDADTGLSARSYEISRLAAGGLLAGVDALLAPNASPEKPSAVFAFVRPPGHHAEPGRGMGFCLFNNAAIAARYALARHNLKRILIVDWDLHHGNGSQAAFYEDPAVLYFSSHQFPYYPGSGNFTEVGAGAGRGFTVNAPFPAGFGDGEYLAVYSRILKPIALEFQADLIIVSAGFDPYFQDPLGGMEVTGNGFGLLAEIVKEIAGRTGAGKILIALEGGYDPEGLRSGVRHVLHVLQGRPIAEGPKEHSAVADQVAEQVIAVQRNYWTSLR